MKEQVSNIDKYIITDFIAKGKIGKVHHAINTITNENVVIKSIVKTDSRYKNKIERDVNIPLMLCHKNIVKIIDFFEYCDEAHIVYPYIPNSVSLDKKFNFFEDNSLDKFQQLFLLKSMVQILDGIEYLHANFIVHRDIKPRNIIVDDNVSVLIDFDLASSLINKKFFVKKGLVGTPHYIAPEIWLGTDNVCYKLADIYSFGITLYHLFHKGNKPYNAKSISTIEYNIRHSKPKKSQSGIPLLDVLIMQIINKNPYNRPPVSHIRNKLNNIIYLQYQVQSQVQYQPQVQSQPQPQVQYQHQYQPQHQKQLHQTTSSDIINDINYWTQFSKCDVTKTNSKTNTNKYISESEEITNSDTNNNVNMMYYPHQNMTRFESKNDPRYRKNNF